MSKLIFNTVIIKSEKARLKIWKLGKESPLILVKWNQLLIKLPKMEIRFLNYSK